MSPPPQMSKGRMHPHAHQSTENCEDKSRVEIRLPTYLMIPPKTRRLGPTVERVPFSESATGMCWRDALLAAGCAALTTVCAQVGLSDVLQSCRSHSFDAAGEKDGRNESCENKETGRFYPAPTITIHRKRGAGSRKRGIAMGKIYSRVLSAGIHHDKAMKSRRHARSAVWWRRRELNPGPKTVSTTDLHV